MLVCGPKLNTYTMEKPEVLQTPSGADKNQPTPSKGDLDPDNEAVYGLVKKCADKNTLAAAICAAQTGIEDCQKVIMFNLLGAGPARAAAEKAHRSIHTSRARTGKIWVQPPTYKHRMVWAGYRETA